MDPPLPPHPDPSRPPVAHAAWQEARRAVLAALADGETLVLLQGLPGIGKTRLLRELEQALHAPGRPVVRLDDGALLELAGLPPLLLVDEADRIPDETLLALARRGTGLAVLAGLPGLAARLADLPHRAVALEPLRPQDVPAYVAARLAEVRLDGRRLAVGTLDALAAAAQGVPGRLNLLAGTSFMAADIDGAAEVTPEHVREAVAMHTHLATEVPERSAGPAATLAPEQEPQAATEPGRALVVLPAPTPPAPPHRAVPWGIAAVAALSLAGGLGWLARPAAPPPIATPAGDAMPPATEASPVAAPDSSAAVPATPLQSPTGEAPLVAEPAGNAAPPATSMPAPTVEAPLVAERADNAALPAAPMPAPTVEALLAAEPAEQAAPSTTAPTPDSPPPADASVLAEATSPVTEAAAPPAAEPPGPEPADTAPPPPAMPAALATAGTTALPPGAAPRVVVTYQRGSDAGAATALATGLAQAGWTASEPFPIARAAAIELRYFFQEDRAAALAVQALGLGPLGGAVARLQPIVGGLPRPGAIELSLPATTGTPAGPPLPEARAPAPATPAPAPLTTPAATLLAPPEAAALAQPGITLSWRPPPGDSADFVEVVELQDEGTPREVFAAYAGAAGQQALRLDRPGRYAWRVLSVSAGTQRYTPSPWRSFSLNETAP